MKIIAEKYGRIFLRGTQSDIWYINNAEQLAERERKKKTQKETEQLLGKYTIEYGKIGSEVKKADKILNRRVKADISQAKRVNDTVKKT